MATDDIVLQIETDKVTVDVRYTTGKPGKLKEMLVKEEDTVAVGQQVATVTEGEEGSKPEEVHRLTCHYTQNVPAVAAEPADTCCLSRMTCWSGRATTTQCCLHSVSRHCWPPDPTV